MNSLYLWLGGGKTQWLLWRGGELSPENILSLVCYRLKDHIVVIDIIIYDDDDEDEANLAQDHQGKRFFSIVMIICSLVRRCLVIMRDPRVDAKVLSKGCAKTKSVSNQKNLELWENCRD